MQNLRGQRQIPTIDPAVVRTVNSPGTRGMDSSAFVVRRNDIAAAVEIADRKARPSNQLITRLNADVFRRLRPFLKQVNLSKDEYLYQQDDPITAVYFPESAVISEFQIAEDGRTIEVSVTGSEGAVGITAALNSSHAINCTQVCVPGTAWRIESEVLEREAARDPALHELLHEYVNSQIRHLSQKLICNTFHSVEQRFCTWLLLLRNRSHVNKFRLTHEHAARVLGVHRPSVTFIAQHLRDRKLISYSRGRISITDHTRLERVACRCYSEL